MFWIFAELTGIFIEIVDDDLFNVTRIHVCTYVT